mgnify:CR=1 FL=1|jgi:hypothetical protein
MTLEKQREILIEYLKMKVEQLDWHGVADAAMDIREVEKQIQVENKLYSMVNKNAMESY